MLQPICKKIFISCNNEHENMHEPLLAWYPYNLFDALKKKYANQQFSLQHF